MKFPTEARLRRIIAFVAALGIGVATYITIVDSGGGAPTCLAGGGGCETVANSSYSHIAGVNDDEGGGSSGPLRPQPANASTTAPTRTGPTRRRAMERITRSSPDAGAQ